MSSRTRNVICGTLIILIAAYLGFLTFRQNTLVSMDMRRDLTIIEHHVIECAKTGQAMEEKNIWSRALIFQDESLKMRGAKVGETYMQMIRRWTQFLQFPYWPSITLAVIGFIICIPLSPKTE